MADLLKGKFDKILERFLVVDCRYPYEFEGGHIIVSIHNLGWMFCKGFFELCYGIWALLIPDVVLGFVRMHTNRCLEYLMLDAVDVVRILLTI